MEENPYRAPIELGEPSEQSEGRSAAAKRTRLKSVLMITVGAIAIYLVAYGWEQAQGRRPMSAKLAIASLALAYLIAGALSAALRFTRS